MKDREFLKWIHARLELVHGDDPLADYMHKLRAIIYSTPMDKETLIDKCLNRLEDTEGVKN